MVKLIGSADLPGLVTATSDALGIPPADIEKDIWVVEVLRSVFRPVDGARVIFKGGTSLSKAYGIIERFSEDVDLLVVPENALSRGGRDRALRELPSRAARDLGTTAAREGNTQEGIHRSERVAYDAAFPDPGRVTAGVLLEMGVRGGPEPSEVRPVRSYAAQWAVGTGVAAEAEYEEFAPVDVVVLRPERTLIEKLALIHHLAATYPQSAPRIPANGRHLHDIYRLLGDEGMRAALRQRGLAERLAADAYDRSQEAGWPATPRPAGGFSASLAFTDEREVRGAFSQALDQASTLVWGERPSFIQVVERVSAEASLL
jgi:hypothetical protein